MRWESLFRSLEQRLAYERQLSNGDCFVGEHFKSDPLDGSSKAPVTVVLIQEGETRIPIPDREFSHASYWCFENRRSHVDILRRHLKFLRRQLLF